MQAADTAILQTMVGAGARIPALWHAARWMTELGGVVALWIVALLAMAWLWSRGRPRRALLLLAVAAGGRLLVELLKWSIDRARPTFIDHPIATHAQSFPSGHAGNSMIVYLAIALIVFGTRSAAAAAIMLAVLIGLTRPLLGVHWPSDVLAGWCLGLAWTLALVQLTRGWVESDRDGGRPPPLG